MHRVLARHAGACGARERGSERSTPASRRDATRPIDAPIDTPIRGQPTGVSSSRCNPTGSLDWPRSAATS